MAGGFLCCPETLMTDGLSSGGGAGGRAAGEGAGRGVLQRAPVSSERPCQRGGRTADLASPETLVRPCYLQAGWSHHTAHAPTYAHSRKASPKPGLPGPSRSSPTSLQPQLLQAACPPPTLPSHPSLHVSDPSHVFFLCRDHYFFCFLFANLASLFVFCALQQTLSLCPFPLQRPPAHISTACPGPAPAMAEAWPTQHRPQEPESYGPRSQGQVDEPQLPCPSLRGTISGHHLQFLKGASRAEPGHPQCNHLLTHLPALPSLSWASPCFLGAPPRETTPTLVFVAGPAFGGPGLSHLPQAPNSSCFAHVL